MTLEKSLLLFADLGDRPMFLPLPGSMAWRPSGQFCRPGEEGPLGTGVGRRQDVSFLPVPATLCGHRGSPGSWLLGSVVDMQAS